MKKASSLRMLAFFMACMVVITTCFTVSIGAVWNFDSEGTGMPDADDPAEGLPYPNEDRPEITEFAFTYAPSVLGIADSAPITTAKAGDIVWLNISVDDIVSPAVLPEGLTEFLGLTAFEGHVVFDYKNIAPYAEDLEDLNYWLEVYTEFVMEEGIYKRTSPVGDMAVFFTEDTFSAPGYKYQHGEDSYAFYWGLGFDRIETGDQGFMLDGSVKLMLPVKIADDVEEGDEFTFTVPYPMADQFANLFNAPDVQVYGRGGSYTITIDNHDEIEANIATDAVYRIGGDEIKQPFANDKRIPLTEKADYNFVEGSSVVDMDFAAPADVTGVTLTFNDTADADLPTDVTVYGVTVDGEKVLLGSATAGTAVNGGVEFYNKELDKAENVNAANAYSYVIGGFDAATYTGISVEVSVAEGAAFALGEIQVEGEYTKFNVTIENGTIADAADDNCYLPGTVLNIVADEIEDKIFTGWTIVEGGAGEFADASAKETTFTVGTATTVIVANYEDVLYPLEVIGGSGTGEYAKGTEVDIEAYQAPYGMVFSHWEVISGDAVVADPTAATTTVTTASGGSVVEAIYEDAPRYAVYVDYGSIATEPDEGYEGYLEGTVVTLVPPTPEELPEGKVFVGWFTLCGSGTLDSANNTFTVGTGDAEIFAKLVDIHKPVEDNLAPDADFMFIAGTPDKTVLGTSSEFWYEGGYLNDQLYPLLAEGKWVPVSSSDNKITLVARLDGAYDITGSSITFAYVLGDFTKIPPMEVRLYGCNKMDTSDKVQLGYLNGNQMGATDKFIPFDEEVGLTSIAAKYDIEVDPSLVDYYQYLIFELSCMSQCTNYRIGEVEIFGTESQFEITIENGTMAPPAEKNLYKVGDVLTITAVDLADKAFVGWTLKNSGIGTFANSADATTTYTVGKGDNKIIAVYRDVLYTLTVTNGTGSGDYVRGSEVTVTADINADPEKVFDKWIVVSGNATIADPNSATTTVTTDGVAEIEATYKNKIYDLTVENGTGSGNYTKGETVDIVANAAPTDMVFSHWMIVSGSGTLEDANSASTKFTTSNEATVLRAVYTDILYKLEIQGGQATSDNDLNGLVVGTRVEIEANVPDHKTFVKWEIVSGAGSFADATSASTTFTTGSGDTVIKAVFEDVEYTLTVENGEGSGDYVFDTVVDIKANVPDGFLFAGWEIVDGEVEIAEATKAETTATVKGDATIKATFVEKEYTVDVINGKVDDADKADSYKKGTVITVIADDAEVNKHFTGWVIVSGDATIDDASAAVAEVTVGSSDVVIRAEYADDLYNVTVENGTADGITEGGNKVGDIITITANDAEANKHFIGWVIVSGEATIADATSATTTVTVGASDVVIRAEYADDLYSVTVENGTATGITEGGNKVGDVITITADEAPEGQKFDKWEIVSGEGTIADETASETTFTLGAANTVIRATYKASGTAGTGDAGLAVFALMAVASLIGTAVIFKKKED